MTSDRTSYGAGHQALGARSRNRDYLISKLEFRIAVIMTCMRICTIILLYLIYMGFNRNDRVALRKTWTSFYSLLGLNTPQLAARGGELFVNVASAAGILSSAEMSPYNATKAAVIAISETLKSELAPFNIGVTVLCPTFIKTNLLEKMRFTDEFQRHCSTTGIDNARWTPEKVACLVIDAVKREKMYVVPQAAAKMFWWSKRISPAAFFGFLAFLMRMGWGRKIMLRMARLVF